MVTQTQPLWVQVSATQKLVEACPECSACHDPVEVTWVVFQEAGSGRLVHKKCHWRVIAEYSVARPELTRQQLSELFVVSLRTVDRCLTRRLPDAGHT